MRVDREVRRANGVPGKKATPATLASPFTAQLLPVPVISTDQTTDFSGMHRCGI
jgi:hypothetical protein